jgi:hypothetical protein
LLDASRHFTDPNDQLEGDHGNHSVETLQALLQLGKGVKATQHAGWDLVFGVKLVEMPPKPILSSGSLSNQVVSVVQQQPYFAARTVELGHWQVRLSQCRPGHRESIDGVGLAARSGHLPGYHGQLWRYPNDDLAGHQQISF